MLQLWTTKLNFAPKPPPAWLRRRRYWIEYLRAPSAEETANNQAEQRAQQTLADAEAVVQYVREQLHVGDGIRLAQSDLESARPPQTDGKAISRDRVREAVRYAVATGLLTWQDLPKAERRGQRRQYLAPEGDPLPEARPLTQCEIDDINQKPAAEETPP